MTLTGCVPCARLAVENAAMPELTVTVASSVPLSKNCIVPVASEFMVVVKVTVWPTTDGLRLDVYPKPILILIDWERGAEVDAALFASPL